MKIKKRFLGILLSLSLMLGMMPGMSLTAYATSDSPYGLYIGGEPVKDDKLSGSGWEFSTGTNTLKLSGVSIDTGYNSAGIYYYKGDRDIPLNIILNGTNTISGNNLTAGIYGDNMGSFIFSGDGTLNTTGTSNGIGAEWGNVTINSGAINASGTENGSSGIYTKGNVTINGGNLNATGSIYGIHGRFGVNITGGTVTVNATNSTSSTCYAIGESGGQQGMSITGGTLTLTATNSNGEAYGLYLNSGGNIQLGSGITSLTITGTTSAASAGSPEERLFENVVAGMGWETVDGTGNGTIIDVNANGTSIANLASYKKLLFPYTKPAATVKNHPTDKTLTYTGAAQELVTAGEASGGTMQYALGKDATTAPTGGWSAFIPKGTDAGIYYVWYKVVGDNGHADSEAACVPATIAKATPAVTAPTAKTLTYTGSAQELVTAGSTNDGKLYYAVTTENKAPTDESLYTTSIPTATNAGTYYVWYKVVGDDSHADHIVDKPIVVTIAEAEVNPSAGESERSVKIEGIVKYSSGTPIDGAEVELMSGKDPIGKTVTNAEDGSYTFEEVLSDGIYNIKATFTNGGQTRTITKLVTVKDAMIQEDANIVFPQENVNSELVIADDTESTVVSGIAVEGITDEAIKYASEAVDGRKVTVKLEAQGKKDLTNADEANLSGADKIIKTEQNNIKNAAKTDNGDQKTLDFLDFKILKTVTDTITNAKVSEDRISETGGLIRIVIKYNFRGKDKLSLYRYHDGSVQEIGESNDSNSERIVIDTTAGTLTAYLKYFSTYAIGYTTTDNSSPGQTTTSSSSSSGSSTGSTVTQTVKMDDIAWKYGITKDEMALTAEVITGLTTDEDPKGSTYYKLLARVTKRAKNSLTVNWDYIPYADGYMVFGARCNTKNKEYKFELLETIDENDITGTRSFAHKDLKAKTYYKYMVVAYKKVGNQKMTVAASKVVHAPTKTAATTVAKKLKTSVSSVKLKVGGTKKLTSTEVKEDKGKKLKRHRKLMYESENPAIATVTKKGGKIKAISKGSVDIYVYAANGTYKKIRVTVK